MISVSCIICPFDKFLTHAFKGEKKCSTASSSKRVLDSNSKSVSSISHPWINQCRSKGKYFMCTSTRVNHREDPRTNQNQDLYRIFALAKSTPANKPGEVRSEQVKHVIPSITVILRIANTINRTSPKNMLAEFSRLVATLKRRIPATDRGILFSDPTRLHRC